MMNGFKKRLHRIFAWQTVLALILSSLAPLMPFASRTAFAAVTTAVDMVGLLNAGSSGFPISPVATTPEGIVRFSVNPSSGGTLTSVRVNFAGTGFSASDLRAIQPETPPFGGVNLIRDAGTIGVLDGGDVVIEVASTTDWIPSSNNIILTPSSTVSLTGGATQFFFVTIFTSTTISHADRISATIPVDGIVTSQGTGPSVAFTSNEYVADTQPPVVLSYEGTVGSPTTTVRFSEPVQRVSGGEIRLADSPLAYVHGGGGQSIAGIMHMAGQAFANVLLDANVTSGDIDASSSTIAAGTNKISDLAGNVMNTATAPLSSPLRITTPVIPTLSAGAAFTPVSPAVTFLGSGGTAPYTFEPADMAATNTLLGLGLTLQSDGKLIGTATTTPGSFGFPVRVIDTAVASSVRAYTINIGGSGGGPIPGITSVTPSGGPQGGSLTVAIQGSNTAFSGASVVEFLMPIGLGGTNGVTASGLTASDATHVSFTATISGGAAAGPRDLRISTGGQNVTMPNAFTVFAGGGSGLTQLLPVSNATGVSIPPSFSFLQSSNTTTVTYRVKVKPSFDLTESVSAIWDYAFTKTVSELTSHCNSTQCNLNYGAGAYRVITPPTPLAPNTDYFWQVYTYATTSVAGTPLEVTTPRRFTTTESVTDTTPPSIMHRPVFSATASANLALFAKVFDNIATQDTTPALSVSVVYCQGSGCTPSTVVSCVAQGGGFYACTIPSADIGSAGTITRYSLRASDGTNTGNFRQPDSSPFQLTAATAGASSIAGLVRDSTGTCSPSVQGATVFAEGTGYSTATAADCTFTLSSLVPGTYDLVAFKTSFAERRIDGIAAGTTGLDVRLNAGGGGGFGGDTSRPTVRMTCPMDRSTNMPGSDSNFKICVVFSEPMNQGTVTTAGNLMVRELNVSSGGSSTDITSTKGSWTYYPTAPVLPGIPPQANMAVWSFNPSQTFGSNKMIAVTVGAGVTDTGGNSVQGNQPDGNYAFSFTTGQTSSIVGTFDAGSGASFTPPPRVVGSTPAPGAFGVPRNSRVVLNFSESMADDAGGYVMRNCLKLFPVSDVSETSILSSASLDASKRIATLVPSATLTASVQYRLKVLSSCRAASGMALGPPGGTPMVMYMAEFRTGATSDSTAPTITGSYPSSGATGIPVGVGSVGVSFSLDMDPALITTDAVYLSVGSTLVNGSVEYRPLERRAIFTPRSALSPNTTYTLNVTTAVTALNGTALGTAVARTFTTGAADTSAPQLRFMNADDHAISLTFSEPMNAATLLDSLNWPRSVVNPDAYDVIARGAAGFSLPGTTVSLSSARFSYDPIESTVLIEGLDLTAARGQELYLSMDTSGANQVKDLSGNLLAATASNVRAPVRSSATTGGALGPGAMTGSAFAAGGFVPTNISTTTFSTFGQVEARPSVPATGATSKYFLRIPLSQQILAGGKVVVTLPSGFSASGAKQDIMSPARQDVNGPGPGTPTFRCLTNVAGGKSCAGGANADDTGAAQGGLADDGVVVDGRVITVYLSANTNSAGFDFLMLDLDGIVNSSIPLDFSTQGYTLDIKTFNGSTLLESLTSRSFYLQSVGSNTLGGTITMPSNDQTCTVNVYLDSPTGGSQTAQASFTGAATAAYTFSSVPSGNVFIRTDRSVTCGSGISARNYTGRNIPDNVLVAGATTHNLTLPSADTGGVAVTVSITGGVGQALDVFAGSPGGAFVVRQVMPLASPESVTLRLQDGFTGFIGVGPQIQPGASGPPPAPTYVMPRPRELRVIGSACFIDGSPTCTASIALASATKTIKGIVKDGSSRLMANVEVFAYSPGGFGTRGQTSSDGTFSLAVNEGIYTVGANIQGLQSREVPVRVSSDATTYLFVDNATTAITPAAALSSFILRIAKPECTISGRVTDGTNVVQNAGVFARRTDGPGFSNAMTDSSGSYTLYVGCTGTWEVSAFNPGYGQMTPQTVTMTTDSQSGINFSPTLVGTFHTVSGSVTVGGTGVQGAIVRISNGTNFNEAVTDVTGAYSVRVPAGSGYIVRAFVPAMGDVPPLAAFTVSADVAGKNFAVGASRTVDIVFSGDVAEGSVDLVSTDGRRSHVDINGGVTTTITIPDGSYFIDFDVPGVAASSGQITPRAGTTFSSGTGLVTVNGPEVLDITLPARHIVSGTVTDGSAPVGDAWVEVVEATTDRSVGIRADDSGAFILNVPAGTYRINAMKPGYLRQPTNLTVAADATGLTLAMSVATLSISGQVTLSGSGVANAFVRAERLGGGFTATQTDNSGNYSLPVNAGTWRVYAVSNGYQEQQYSGDIEVVATSLTGRNIALSTASSFNLAEPGSQPISTANGGTIEDTDAGLRVVAPPNAVATDGSSATITYTETTNVPETPGAHPLPGFQMAAQGEDGNSLNNFSDSVTLEMSYTPAELAGQEAADGSAIDTMTEINALQMASFDPTTNAWDPIATTITCEDASGNPILNPASPAACTEIVIAASAEHFSLYAPIVATDPGAPATPTGFAAAAGGTTSISLSWTVSSGADSYDIYRSSSESGTYTRLGSEPTVSSGATVTYSDTGLSAGTRYYYKITALNGTNESAASSAVSAQTTAAAVSSGGGGGGGSAGSGGGSSVQTIVTLGQTTTTTVTTPATSTRTTTSTTVTTTTSSTPAPSATLPTVSAPATVTPVIGPQPLTTVPPVRTPAFDGVKVTQGGSLKFIYGYTNATKKVQPIKITREIFDASGKRVKLANGSANLKAGGRWEGRVSETLPKTWKPGLYRSVAKIMDAKTKKVLQTTTLQILIEAPAPKVMPAKPATPAVPATPAAPGVKVVVASQSIVLVQGQKLNYSYWYLNEGKATQSIKITREIFNSAGKRLKVANGSASLKPGKRFDANVNEALSADAPGDYRSVVTVKDAKTGRVIQTITQPITVREQ